jgi:hypothetical protein
MKYSRFMYATAAVAAIAGCGGGGTTGGLDAEQNYYIALTPAAEVPAPKPTSATGTAEIVVLPSSIEFQLTGSNITGITMAHIHSGAVGVAGPVVVTLFQPTSPTSGVNGLFASGTISASNLPSGVTLQSLKTLLLSGNAYVNVHTSVNPSGEIRGQIK